MDTYLKTATAFVYSGALLLGFAAPVQKTARPPSTAERFLFVVNTSSSMKRLDAANRQTLFDLIYEGLNGRMRSNDTYGIWTFDENTYAGEFPMQIWNPTNNLNLASQAATFLKSRRYRGATQFQPMVGKLMSVIRTVKDVNIFIISDGDTPFAGTSVDQTVNASYAARATERRRAKKPFITTLVARDGSISAGSVTIAGEPIALPDRPVPVRTVKADISTLRSASSNSTQMSTGAVSASVQPKPAKRAIIIQTKSANQGREDISSTVGNVATARSTNTDPSLAVAGSSSNVPPVISQLTTTQIAQTESSAALPKTTNASVDQVSPLPDSEFKASAVRKLENVERSSRLANDKESGASPLVSGPVRSTSSVPSLLPNVLTVTAREPNGSTNLDVTKSSALTAVAVTTEAFLRPRTMVLIGAGLFAAALGVLVWAVKRYRSVPQASFISRSMDRQ